MPAFCAMSSISSARRARLRPHRRSTDFLARPLGLETFLDPWPGFVESCLVLGRDLHRLEDHGRECTLDRFAHLSLVQFEGGVGDCRIEESVLALSAKVTSCSLKPRSLASARKSAPPASFVWAACASSSVGKESCRIVRFSGVKNSDFNRS